MNCAGARDLHAEKNIYSHPCHCTKMHAYYKKKKFELLKHIVTVILLKAIQLCWYIAGHIGLLRRYANSIPFHIQYFKLLFRNRNIFHFKWLSLSDHPYRLVALTDLNFADDIFIWSPIQIGAFCLTHLASVCLSSGTWPIRRSFESAWHTTTKLEILNLCHGPEWRETSSTIAK